MTTGPSLTTVRVTPRLLVAGTLGGLALTSGIALTATSGWLIVRASERPVILTLLTAIVAVRTFGIARPALRYAERLQTHDAALGDLAGRRTQTYAALVPLTPARLGRRGRADLLDGVVDDLDDVVSTQIRVSVPIMSAVVAATVTVVLTAVIDPPTSMVLAGLLAVVALVCLGAWALERASQDDLLGARAEVARISELVAHQAGEIRAVGAADGIAGRLERAHDVLSRATVRQARGRTLSASLVLAAGGGATILIALLASGTWGSPAPNGLSPAVLALLVLTPVAVVDAYTPLTDAMRTLARSQASAHRLEGLLRQDAAVVENGRVHPQALGAPHLHLQRVSASWSGTTPHLRPITLDVTPGTHLAVTGANGSGKSTLIAVLARHLDPATGSYTIDGADVADLDLEQTRARFAVVDDEPHVFASTVRENLRLARPDATDQEVEEALRRAGLGPWLDTLPDRLDTRVGTGGRGVSGGERARLAVARALLSRRPVILLDEPVAHLDHSTALAVVEDLLTASRDRTVIMVSHRPDGLEQFDEVIDLSPHRGS